MNRRTFIGTGTAALGLTALGADEKTTDGGLAPVSWSDRVRREVPLLPPGAHSAAQFLRKCVGCGLCAAACPSKCLRPSDDPRRFGRVELDFRHGWCKPGCTRCGEVCPTGAIEKVPYVGKHLVHTGRAVWHKDRCVITTDGVTCHACEKHCPKKAVRLVSGFPVVDAVLCTGCGACEHYCPARPETAIRVEPYARHREVRPMDEGDVLVEMQRVLATGKAAVVAQNGVIVAALEGRGVKPLLALLDKSPELLTGAHVLDRVCGRASAAICVVGGVRKVSTPVIAAEAKALLEQHGIEVSAGEVVSRILNRDKSDGCPLEAMVSGAKTPKEMVGILRARGL